MTPVNFILYNDISENISVNIILKDETIWLTQKSMAELFGVNVPAVNKYLKKIFTKRGINIKCGCFKFGNNHSTWSNRGENSKKNS